MDIYFVFQIYFQYNWNTTAWLFIACCPVYHGTATHLYLPLAKKVVHLRPIWATVSFLLMPATREGPTTLPEERTHESCRNVYDLLTNLGW